MLLDDLIRFIPFGGKALVWEIKNIALGQHVLSLKICTLKSITFINWGKQVNRYSWNGGPNRFNRIH